MSDAMLGFLILLSPVYVTILMWPRLRRLVFAPVRATLRFLAAMVGVAGIMLADDDVRRVLLATAAPREREPARGRHVARERIEPAYLDTAPDDVPAPVPTVTGIEPYTPEWYDVIYDLQD